jgi:hypothetical protein
MNMPHKECLPEKGWMVLSALKDALSEIEVVLAGGTALALHLGHRISVDLDFFSAAGGFVDNLISHIQKTGFSYRILSETSNQLIASIEDVKFSVFRYDYPFADEVTDVAGIRVAGILDIASMKVIAMGQRGTKRDFVDLYFILQKIPFHLIAENMVRRFGKERINPVHLGKAFVYFTDADADPDPKYTEGNVVDWNDIKSFFRHHVRQFVYDLDAAQKRCNL